MTLAKPPWLKIRPPTTAQYKVLREKIPSLGLHTICEEGHCPNMAECWSSGTASFMVLGDTCTRGCRFCAVKTAAKGKAVDALEPLRLAKTVAFMKLKYVVITSVDRDDLSDQGAEHFAQCIQMVKKYNPETIIEVLTPDFRGDKNGVQTILNAKPHVFGHNIETVKRLQPVVRDRRANYEQSLRVLKMAKEISPKVFTKTAIMVGLGEQKEEIVETLSDLLAANVQLLSLGQYLQPSPAHFPLQQFVSPVEFEELKKIALEKGFLFCQAGPFVRSSYKAGEFFMQQQQAK